MLRLDIDLYRSGNALFTPFELMLKPAHDHLRFQIDPESFTR
jgi:hypothetical protein